jgi:hypothetical protein
MANKKKINSTYKNKEFSKFSQIENLLKVQIKGVH